jgi:hypothetical protein
VGTETLFFCEKCGMVKMINIWNNCSGLTEGKLLDAIPTGQSRLNC